MPHPLESYIRDIPDFPTEGIVFKDITTLLENPVAFQEALNALLMPVQNLKIDKVVGIEARGFIFGSLMANKLSAGFIPVRKPGKLPFKTIHESYELEYGKDTLEMHVGAIHKGDQVLLHDDLLATGGTAKAACKLIENQGGKVIMTSFLLELGFLNGRDKLKDYNIHSVICY